MTEIKMDAAGKFPPMLLLFDGYLKKEQVQRLREIYDGGVKTGCLAFEKGVTVFQLINGRWEQLGQKTGAQLADELAAEPWPSDEELDATFEPETAAAMKASRDQEPPIEEKKVQFRQFF